MPPLKQYKSWQAPSFLEPGKNRMAWIDECCVGEGENWLRGQSAYQDIPKGLDIISGKIDERANQQRSDLNINHAKYNIRKIVGALSDVRQVGQYTSDAKFYLPQAEMYNKLTKAIALESEWPRRLRECLQYMSLTAKGYIWPRFARLKAGYGEGRFEFLPLGLMDVLTVQMPTTNNLQGAYSNTIFEFMPVWQAHGKWPQWASQLLPVARRRYSSTVSTRRLDLAEKFKYGEPSMNWANLYCEIRYTFINDLAINESPFALPMGEWSVDAEGQPKEPLTSWSYMVPFKGMQIADGVDAQGQKKMREATFEDCRIYPHMRLVISSKGMSEPIYDGPAKDWHGMTPLASYCADDWPWEPSGFSLIHDIYSIERARQTLERGMDQVAKHRSDPGLLFDRNAGLNDTAAENLDPFEERKRIGVDGATDKVFSTTLPQWLLEIPNWYAETMKYLLNAEDAQLGLNEIQNLAEFKANLNNESMDKALPLVGPLVKDISAGMESSTANVWQMLKYMIPQYLTTRRAMQYIGPDNITPEVYDHDPNSLVPSHGYDEFMSHYDPAKSLEQQVVIPHKSVYGQQERSRMAADNLRLISIPHTMHDITQSQEQLKYLTLFRSGFPISSYDVAKKLNIENFGEIEGATMHERWLNEQKEKMIMMSQAKQLAIALGLDNPMDDAQTGPHGGQSKTGGRPPSGKQGSKIKQKRDASGGVRPVVSESG